MPRSVPGGIGAVERILYLKKLPSLAGLSAADLAVVAEDARERYFRRGEALLSEGAPIEAIHFVVDGRVHITRHGQVLGHAGPGAAVGGYGLLARDPDGIGAVAETDTLTLELAADSVMEALEDHFSILLHLLGDVCRQIIALQTRMPEALMPSMPRATPMASPVRELDLVERIFFLRQAAPFRRASINALAELSRGLNEVRFESGVSLWQPGDASGWLLLVVNGAVECTLPGSGEGFPAGPGSPVGVVESLAGQPRWYSAVTRSRVVGLQGQAEGLVDVFEDNFEIAMDYLAVMCRWLIQGFERASEAGQPVVGQVYGCDEPELPAAAADGT